jgi:hypothetical protein
VALPVAGYRSEWKRRSGVGANDRRWWARAWLVVVLVALAACTRTPPEQRLRMQIAAMADALQQRQASQVMAPIASDFAGGDGLDRRGLQRLLQVQLLGNAAVGATLGPVAVELHGDTAEARFDAVLTGGSGRLLPERVEAWRVTTAWRRDGADWQLYSAQWEPVGGD